MTKIMQVIAGVCHWDASRAHKTIEETVDKYPPGVLFVEAPDYVFPGWGYVDGRFVAPTVPEGWAYDAATGTFYPLGQEEEIKTERYRAATLAKIRSKISAEDECKILREILAYPNDPTAQARFAEYNEMVQACRMQAMDEYYPVEEASIDDWTPDTEYQRGDVRIYNELYYRCLQRHDSQADWTPEVAVSLWVKIPAPGVEWPEWVQPTGAHDAYAMGAKTSHKGKHWVSNVDHNVWEPGVYGWEESA